ncbi:hypothetical protein [Chryseobacterium daeguense]|uniref:hypothetical protein n=1 Tax=Chryseobacterium daeguense TaxID=412438 RepID=UPI00041BD3D6|nr:hypothetical protein [Chryseobacterium daeguense]
MSDHSDIYKDFIPGTKVFLENEYGGIIDFKADKLSTIIRWDTPKEDDIEDWFSMRGSFFDLGGRIINQDYKFKYINDDGSLKDI